jgi:protein-disulfide isomerase
MASMMKTALVAFVFICSFGCASRTAPPAQGNEVIATIDGKAIYENDLLPAIDSQLRQLRTREYELKRRALDVVIQQKSLEAEAARKGVSVRELLMIEVDSKVIEPTDAEARAFYEERKDSLKHPFDAEMRAEILKSLKQERLREARSAYVDQLLSRSNVAILLAPHRTEVSHDPSRLRGNPDAPVTIVEFSDFECPYCQSVQPTLHELMTKYEGKVRLSYRDFPLREIHPNADGAAVAARCAGEQGKFWEYHDLLFKNRNQLDPASLKGHAHTLKLDENQFGKCIESGKFRQSVQEDLDAGMKAGVSGTPGFFINGVALSGAQPLSAFEEIIDSELKSSR